MHFGFGFMMSIENLVWNSKFENCEFSENIAAGDRKCAKKCPGVLAGANFIACGAAARLGAGAAAAPE